MNGAHAQDNRPTADHRRAGPVAFTLIELIVVVAIIALLLTISLPSVTRMWDERKNADAENTLKGLLGSARMQALHDKERGLFFYLENGVQKIAFIEAEPPNVGSVSGQNAQPDAGLDRAPGTNDDVTEQMTPDRFRVVEGHVYELPQPMRAVPRAILDREGGQYIWHQDEIANEDYKALLNVAPGGTENHRNFFTLIFSADGQLVVGRSVFIHDGPTDEWIDTPEAGRITGLRVMNGNLYQGTNGSLNNQFDPSDSAALPAMVFAEQSPQEYVALNFPSVDGVLVYDDSVFQDYPDEPIPVGTVDKREYLRLNAQPLYVSRLSGAVIPGPRGEPDAVP